MHEGFDGSARERRGAARPPGSQKGSGGRAVSAPRRRLAPWLLIGGGFLLLAAVGAWQLNASLWSARSSAAGHALVHRFDKDAAIAAPVTNGSRTAGAALAACRAGARADPVRGLLEIPSLGVVAPVVNGTGDAQLDVAVGHDAASVWPGSAGTSVLAAHDVSYFQSIARLRSGDLIRFVAPCTTYEFKVASHAVVKAGSPVYNTPAPSVALVTCWPTDALWFTPDRYVVSAVEVNEARTSMRPHRYATAASAPSVPVPAALAAEGVTLTTYWVPMGTFSLAGNPSKRWANTTGPLLAEGAGVDAYIAGVKALTQGRVDWWREVAPGVPPPAPLLGADNPSYLTSLDVTVDAAGSAATSVELSNTATVAGGKAPGSYRITVVETVHRGELTISSWSMQPT